MPLIIVTGLPCSGKSTTSKNIAECLGARLTKDGDLRQVRIVSDSDTLDWDGRNSIFTSIPKEKELRSWLKAEAQRYINLNQIVILDCAAYIKGFRYELYCMTKEAKTQYAVVEKRLSRSTCLDWNSQRAERHDLDKTKDPDEPSPAYDSEVFDALMMRYEECDDSNRWDSPLFRLRDAEESLDMEKLYDSITKENPLAPNKCTLTSTTTSTIYKPTK